MKKFIYLTLLLSFSNIIKSQDIIFYNNGDEKKVKVIRILEEESKTLPKRIIYKYYNDSEGPEYVQNIGIEKNEIYKIKYKGGRIEIFNKSIDCGKKPKQPFSQFTGGTSYHQTSKEYREYLKNLKAWEECKGKFFHKYD